MEVVQVLECVFMTVDSLLAHYRLTIGSLLAHYWWLLGRLHGCCTLSMGSVVDLKHSVLWLHVFCRGLHPQSGKPAPR